MKTIIGDLLSIESGTILHQVNCRGVVGGLAGALHRKYPQAFESYFGHCGSHPSVITHGGYLVSRATDSLFICHIFGQIEPGQNTDIKAVGNAFRASVIPQLSIYAPYKMGCGIGGGDWEKYSAIIERYYPECVIIQRPEDV